MPDTLETLAEFRKINDSFPYTEPIKEWKGQGGKVVGWLCTYVPEEIIHAAGALPIRVTGGTEELMLEEATAYLGVMLCSFARSCLQLAIDKEYDFLDGLVGVGTCEGVRHLAEVWEHYIQTPLIYILPLPHKTHERAQEFYREELEVLKKRAEDFLGVEISEQALSQSIALYNRTRELLSELYDLRKSDTPPISGTETLEVMNASAGMPREQYNQLLERLISEARASNRALTGKARLMLSGSILNNPNFMETIEDLGALVVVDELCSGIRYWIDPVDTSLDPMSALAKRYLTRFPCARMNPFEERFRRLLPVIKDFRVDGVVTRAIRYCNPYIHEQYLLRKALEKEGVPVLDLDVEYGMPGTAQIRTRVQAFLEMILEGRDK